jgi:hypothetical protein
MTKHKDVFVKWVIRFVSVYSIVSELAFLVRQHIALTAIGVTPMNDHTTLHALKSKPRASILTQIQKVVAWLLFYIDSMVISSASVAERRSKR